MTADATPVKIAFVTMVRDEPFFLPLWVRYYSRIAPRAHLFVVCDGLDQHLPPGTEGCQILRLPQGVIGPGWDDARWRMLTCLTHALLERFDIVVMNDVDELIALDPTHGDDLAAAIAEAREIGVISPFAIELVHRTDLEPEPLRPDLPILHQRHYGRINASYCKPCITARKVHWSIGGHSADFPDLHLSHKLFLFHLRAVDAGMLMERQLKRRSHLTGADGKLIGGVAGGGWARGSDEVDSFLASFQSSAPEITDFSFGWQRARIERSWRHDPDKRRWVHDTLHNRRSYRSPDRFADIF